MNILQKLWQRGRDLLPVEGFHFDRPIVVFQSDDWGRAGLRDRQGLDQLAAFKRLPPLEYRGSRSSHALG